MKERPILFSAPMVRAILEGRKTQTRRLVKPQPPSVEDVRKLSGSDYHLSDLHVPGVWSAMGPVWAVRRLRAGTDDIDSMSKADRICEWRCPYGAPGDRLWVREAHARFSVGEGMSTPVPDCVAYRASCGKNNALDYTNSRGEVLRLKVTKWTPGIHMPRWASRITLEVTGVRVERLQVISYNDAIAEGARRFDNIPGNGARWSMEQPTHTEQCLGSPQMAFANLYNKVHAGENWNLKPGPSPWDENPWVWVVEFRRIEAQERAA